MKAIAFLSAWLLVSALTGCAELSGEGDIQSSKYSSFQDALQKGAFNSGWLPQALPRSAMNIVETHNVDTNEVWTTFRYSNDDIRALMKECAPDGVRLPNAERTKRDVTWWPAELTDASDTKLRRNLILLSCPSMRHAQSEYRANLAVDRANRVAWYWIYR